MSSELARRLDVRADPSRFQPAVDFGDFEAQEAAALVDGILLSLTRRGAATDRDAEVVGEVLDRDEVPNRVVVHVHDGSVRPGRPGSPPERPGASNRSWVSQPSCVPACTRSGSMCAASVSSSGAVRRLVSSWRRATDRESGRDQPDVGQTGRERRASRYVRTVSIAHLRDVMVERRRLAQLVLAVPLARLARGQVRVGRPRRRHTPVASQYPRRRRHPSGRRSDWVRRNRRVRRPQHVARAAHDCGRRRRPSARTSASRSARSSAVQPSAVA